VGGLLDGLDAWVRRESTPVQSVCVAWATRSTVDLQNTTRCAQLRATSSSTMSRGSPPTAIIPYGWGRRIDQHHHQSGTAPCERDAGWTAVAAEIEMDHRSPNSVRSWSGALPQPPGDVLQSV